MKLSAQDIRPLYDRVKDILRERIEKRELRENAPIPSKEQLARTLGVSDMTVRRALIELTNEGWLTRIRGKGTFVRAREPRAKTTASNTCIAVVSNADMSEMRGSLFYHRIIQSMHQAADVSNAFLCVKKLAEREAVTALKVQEISGFVLLGGVNDEVITALEPLDRPTVLVDNPPPKTKRSYDEVNHFDENAAFDAVSELIQLGHEHIGIIVTGATEYFFKQRLDGYHRALARVGIKPDPRLLCVTVPTSQAGYTATLRLLASHPHCTAIFGTTDEFAVGAIAAARDRKRAVPDDLSVMGFGDIGLFSVPALSTSRIPLEQMGQLAIEALLRRIADPSVPPQRVILNAEWIARASTGLRRVQLHISEPQLRKK